MSILAVRQVGPKTVPLTSYYVAFRGLSTTACLEKNRKAGVPKITPFRTKRLTYEEAQPPSKMYVTKGFLSWNTTNLYDEGRHGETLFEDSLIRRFMFGTWHSTLASEVVIRRRHNVIILSFIVNMERFMARQIYFLKGYTEELLSHWLKCIVKVELQAVSQSNDMVFKKI